VRCGSPYTKIRTLPASEAETFWTGFLRSLARRGLRGVKLVVSDAHEGLKVAAAKIFNASWQRCRVHFMRNVLAHAGKQGRWVVAAFIATAFAQNDRQLELLGLARQLFRGPAELGAAVARQLELQSGDLGPRHTASRAISAMIRFDAAMSSGRASGVGTSAIISRRQGSIAAQP
jgi:mutator family transposase